MVTPNAGWTWGNAGRRDGQTREAVTAVPDFWDFSMILIAAILKIGV